MSPVGDVDVSAGDTAHRVQVRDGQSGPGPGTKFLFLTGTKVFFLPEPGPKIFLTRTSTKNFSEQDQDQNVFLDRDHGQNIFDWNPHPKFVSEGTGTKT